jgi:hypothetical protein
MGAKGKNFRAMNNGSDGLEENVYVSGACRCRSELMCYPTAEELATVSARPAKNTRQSF